MTLATGRDWRHGKTSVGRSVERRFLESGNVLPEQVNGKGHLKAPTFSAVLYKGYGRTVIERSAERREAIDFASEPELEGLPISWLLGELRGDGELAALFLTSLEDKAMVSGDNLLKESIRLTRYLVLQENGDILATVEMILDTRHQDQPLADWESAFLLAVGLDLPGDPEYVRLNAVTLSPAFENDVICGLPNWERRILGLPLWFVPGPLVTEALSSSEEELLQEVFDILADDRTYSPRELPAAEDTGVSPRLGLEKRLGYTGRTEPEESDKAEYVDGFHSCSVDRLGNLV